MGAPAELSGQMPNSYRLHREIKAVITVNGKPQILPIPAGSIITVTEPEPSVETGLVAVEWGDKIVKMFAIDVRRRGVMLA
jgi:hypothetical protein